MSLQQRRFDSRNEDYQSSLLRNNSFYLNKTFVSARFLLQTTPEANLGKILNRTSSYVLIKFPLIVTVILFIYLRSQLIKGST